MKNVNETSEQTFTQKLSAFFAAHRSIMAITAIVLVLIIAAAVVWDTVKNNKNEKATLLSEEIIDIYSEWSADMENAQLEEELMSSLDSAFIDYDGSFAEQRALFTRGQYYIQKELWTEASADFYSLYQQYPDSYLAPVSLYNAATTIKMAGSDEKAIEYLEQLVVDFESPVPEVPEALFELGRLNENMGNTEKAVEYYEQLILDFSDTDWTNLAKSRIIFLNL